MRIGKQKIESLESFLLQKGFTLIELLVVIAIIGILAGIVLVALGGARNKAKDARIMSDMGQIRTQAENVFSTENNYDKVRCKDDPPGADYDPEVATLCDDIAIQGGTTGAGLPGPRIVRSGTPADKFCAKVKLNSGKWWCTDYQLRSALYDNNPVTCTWGPPPSYTCE